MGVGIYHWVRAGGGLGGSCRPFGVFSGCFLVLVRGILGVPVCFVPPTYGPNCLVGGRTRN